MTLQVLKIVDGTSVDGPGLRTSVYFAGCSHHCPECHNPQSWNPRGGEEMTIEQLLEHIGDNDSDVTFSGGDPLFQVEALTELARMIKHSGKNIWCYTGYTYEQIATTPRLAQILPHIDVLVDGPFIATLKDISLRFRGSANQRIIDVPHSNLDRITFWED